MQKITVVGIRQCEFVLWKVNKPTLWKNILDDMYHASLNLSLRVAHEMEQGSEVCKIPSYLLHSPAVMQFQMTHSVQFLTVCCCSCGFLQLISLPPEKREGPLLEKLDRLRSTKRVLEESLRKLDDAIMLFHDFWRNCCGSRVDFTTSSHVDELVFKSLSLLYFCMYLSSLILPISLSWLPTVIGHAVDVHTLLQDGIP